MDIGSPCVRRCIRENSQSRYFHHERGGAGKRRSLISSPLGCLAAWPNQQSLLWMSRAGMLVTRKRRRSSVVGTKPLRLTCRVRRMLLLLLLLLRHGSPEGHPRIALGYFTLKALLVCPPHAIVMRLHGRDSYAVILIPGRADLLGL